MKAKASDSILVVDDDPNLRKTLADILEVKGYETVVAANGAEAIAATENRHFSLALIDLMLPDMSGLEVMASIKSLSSLTEVIILTGHASMDTAIEATRQGAYSYLIKPYQMDELLRQIRLAVEREQAQVEILRLASFPKFNPSAVIELDAGVEVTYLNPVAERLFPELDSMGLSHPLLQGTPGLIDDLRQGRKQGDAVFESSDGELTYELHISYIREVDLIHIYVLNITQRKQTESEIYLLATTDSLTGIANRREFSAILAREVARAERYGTPLSLVMYDIDHFKRINDSFGHDVGDAVLQTITALAKENVRDSDIVARWGGEEFMLLMPESDINVVRTVAEKLRLAIAGHGFDKDIKLTVSFGATAYAPRDDMNSLLKRVDDALYRAKDNGRNRVEVLYGEEACV